MLDSLPRPDGTRAPVHPTATHIRDNEAVRPFLGELLEVLDELARLIGELYPASFPVSSARN